MRVQKCPKIVEKWESYVPIDKQNQAAINIMSIIFFIVMIFVMIFCTINLCTNGEFINEALYADWSFWDFIKENLNPKNLLSFLTVKKLMKSNIYLPIIFLNLYVVIKILTKLF